MSTAVIKVNSSVRFDWTIERREDSNVTPIFAFKDITIQLRADAHMSASYHLCLISTGNITSDSRLYCEFKCGVKPRDYFKRNVGLLEHGNEVCMSAYDKVLPWTIGCFLTLEGLSLDETTQTESSMFSSTSSSQTSYTSLTNSIRLLDIMPNNFERYYNDISDTDCVMIAGNVRFPAHRAVLSARSRVFETMFLSDTPESRSGEVHIPEIPANTLNEVLHYVYSGKIRGLTAETAASMYTAAAKFILLELREESLKFLLDNLTIENLCETAIVAQTHGLYELKRKVVHFVKERLEEVKESDSWKEFFVQNPLLVNRILCEALLLKK